MAMTRIEALVVLSIVVILTGLLLPALLGPKRGGHKTRCASNLKQVGLAFRIFSNDNDELYPYSVEGQHLYGKDNAPHGQGGNPLLYQNPAVETWQIFQVLSNELASTMILLCPEDRVRQDYKALNYLQEDESLSAEGKRDLSVSYFVGLNASEMKPQSILVGDRNITGPARGPIARDDAPYMPGGTHLLQPGTSEGSQRRWSTAIKDSFHENFGYIGFADGSVQQVNAARLGEQLEISRESYGTNSWLFSFPNEKVTKVR